MNFFRLAGSRAAALFVIACSAQSHVVHAQAEESNPRRPTIGLVLGGGGFATLVIAPIMGALADRFGRWRVLIVAAVLETLLWPIPAWVSSFAAFGVAWALVSGVASGVFAVSFSVLSSSAALEIRGRVMAFAYVPVNVGFLVGAALGTLVTGRDIFVIFPITAAVTALGTVALVIAGRRLG